MYFLRKKIWKPEDTLEPARLSGVYTALRASSRPGRLTKNHSTLAPGERRWQLPQRTPDPGQGASVREAALGGTCPGGAGAGGEEGMLPRTLLVCGGEIGKGSFRCRPHTHLEDLPIGAVAQAAEPLEALLEEGLWPAWVVSRALKGL